VVLVDTSVWIEVFRKPARQSLEKLIDLDEVVTCLPVVQEVLQGFGNEEAFATARTSMYAFPIVDAPLTSQVFDHAVDLYRAARRSGATVRSGVDCLIAASAIRHGLEVLHRDRDYDEIARISPLKARRV